MASKPRRPRAPTAVQLGFDFGSPAPAPRRDREAISYSDEPPAPLPPNTAPVPEVLGQVPDREDSIAALVREHAPAGSEPQDRAQELETLGTAAETLSAELEGHPQATQIWGWLPGVLRGAGMSLPEGDLEGLGKAHAALALQIEKTLEEQAPAFWRNHAAREAVVLNALFPLLWRNAAATQGMLALLKGLPELPPQADSGIAAKALLARRTEVAEARSEPEPAPVPAAERLDIASSYGMAADGRDAPPAAAVTGAENPAPFTQPIPAPAPPPALAEREQALETRVLPTEGELALAPPAATPPERLQPHTRTADPASPPEPETPDPPAAEGPVLENPQRTAAAADSAPEALREHPMAAWLFRQLPDVFERAGVPQAGPGDTGYQGLIQDYTRLVLDIEGAVKELADMPWQTERAWEAALVNVLYPLMGNQGRLSAGLLKLIKSLPEDDPARPAALKAARAGAEPISQISGLADEPVVLADSAELTGPRSPLALLPIPTALLKQSLAAVVFQRLPEVWALAGMSGPSMEGRVKLALEIQETLDKEAPADWKRGDWPKKAAVLSAMYPLMGHNESATRALVEILEGMDDPQLQEEHPSPRVISGAAGASTAASEEPAARPGAGSRAGDPLDHADTTAAEAAAVQDQETERPLPAAAGARAGTGDAAEGGGASATAASPRQAPGQTPSDRDGPLEMAVLPQEAPSSDLWQERLIGAFMQQLRHPEGFRNILDARRIWAQESGRTPGLTDFKGIDELLEQAVVRSARQIIAEADRSRVSPQEILDQLVILHDRQPKLSAKTSTSVRNQAYSTPVPLAYVASQLAGITADTCVDDPAAGNGALLICASLSKVRANEINPDRVRALAAQGFAPTTEDATVYAPPPKQADVVIANPPFGTRQREGTSEVFSPQVLPLEGPAYTTTDIDHAICFKALEGMKDSGRAVLLVAGPNPKLLENTDAVKRDEGIWGVYRQGAKSEFYRHLYHEYNVVEHFTVAGTLYESQGAGWPIDVIVIHGRGRSALAVPRARRRPDPEDPHRDIFCPPKLYTHWDDLKELLKHEHEQTHAGEGAHRPLEPDERQPLGSGGRNRVPAGDGTQRIELPGAPGRAPARDANGLPASPADIGANPGAPGALGTSDLGDRSVPAGGGDEPRPGGPAFERPSSGAGDHPAGRAHELRVRHRAGPAGAGPRGALPQPDGLGGDAQLQSGRAPGVTPDGRFSEAPGPTPPHRERPQPLRVAVDAQQVPYQPASALPPLKTLIPSGMASAARQAMDQLIREVGDVDHYVARELRYPRDDLGKYFAAEQVDAIALILYQFSLGRGFILGDQTGIGKGRVVAALIRYSILNGRTPVFVTESPPLYAAMYLDLIDIGMKPGELKIFMSNAGKRIPLTNGRGESLGELISPELSAHNQAMQAMMAQGRLEKNYNIIFTTYDQMNTLGGEANSLTGEKPPTLRMQWLRSLIERSDLYLDESHNAGGTEVQSRFGGPKEEQGKTGRAGFVRELVRLSLSTLYSSATYAKRPSVMDLYLATDILKGVDNKAEDLAPALARGGIPLQQVLATMLTQSGQYLRRERDFSGITYATHVTRVNREVAEGLSRIMRALVQFDVARKDAISSIQETLDARGVRVDGKKLVEQADSVNFASKLNNMISQMLLALQVDEAATAAIEALKSGEKPVIALANTMGSFIAQYVEENGVVSGASIDLSFSQLMRRYLESSRTVTIRWPGKRKPSDPPPRKHYLTDRELAGSVGEALGEWDLEGNEVLKSDRTHVSALDAYREVQRLITKLTPLLKQIPISPIDWIHHRLRQAGYTSGEITGRSATINYDPAAGATYRLRPPKELSDAAKVRARDGFNNGEIDALIINEAGSTGFSFQCSRKFRNQQPRVGIIVQTNPNVDVHMQTLGRINRTDQVHNPRYVEYVADIPAATRYAALLAAKMSSLNANTTADIDSAVKSKEALDLFNSFGDKAAAMVIGSRPALNQILGSPVHYESLEGTARRVTGRLPMLPIPQQEWIYKELYKEFTRSVEEAEHLGQNVFAARRMDLDARSLSRVPLLPGIPGDRSPFAAPVDVELMDVKVLGKPYPSDYVTAQVRSLVGAHEGQSLKDGMSEHVQAHQQRLISRTRDELSARFQALVRGYSGPQAQDAPPEEAQRIEAQISKARERALQSFKAWEERISYLAPGLSYQLRLPDGSHAYAILAQVYAEGGESVRSRPTALSRWHADFFLADARRRLTVKLSRIEIEGITSPADKYARGKRKDESAEEEIELGAAIAVTQVATDERGTPVIDLFDLRQGDLREQRWMICAPSNLFEGFAKSVKGQIILFTTDQEELRAGILLDRDFDPQQFMQEQPVQLMPAQMPKFFKLAAEGRVGTGDGVLSIVKDANGGYRISVPVPKREGGVYYLDEGLTAITGDFASQGKLMHVNVTEAQLVTACEYITSCTGGTVQRLQTQTFKEEAIKAGGTRFGELQGIVADLSHGASTAVSGTEIHNEHLQLKETEKKRDPGKGTHIKPDNPYPKALGVLAEFIGPQQLQVMRGLAGLLPGDQPSEEAPFFKDKILDLARLIEGMPVTYTQREIPRPEGRGFAGPRPECRAAHGSLSLPGLKARGFPRKSGDQGEKAVVYLHYFSGASDWYITEKDQGEPKEPGQQQAFGYAILNGDEDNAEWGYISLVDLAVHNIELDLYFEPRPFCEIQVEREQRVRRPPAHVCR